MLLLLATLALADEPVETPEPVTIDVLRKLPNGWPWRDDTKGLAAIRSHWARVLYDESCNVTACTTAWGESYVRPEIPELQEILVPPDRRARRFRPDPFDVLPTGHTVAGLLGLVRGADPRDPTRIGGAPMGVVLDGATLGNW